ENQPPMIPRYWSAAILLLVACRAAPDRATSLRVTIDSTGHYPVVRSLGEAPTESAKLVAVVDGSVSSQEFGSIRSVLLAADGSLYVADPSNRVVSVFDSAGRFVRQLGREGRGPGEYRDPYSLAWLGPRLALLDPGNARIAFYEPSGEATSSPNVPSISGGQFIRLYRTPPAFWSYSFRATAGGSEGIFVQHSEAGTADSLPLIKLAAGAAVGRRCTRPDEGISFFSAPFGPELLQIPSPDGLLVAALTSGYAIAFVNRQGDTVRMLKRDIRAAPVSDAEWSEANADWVAFRAKWPTAACDLGEFSRPKFKPPLQFIFYDDVGRLWVELTTADGPRYDVFDATGRLQVSIAGLPSTGGVDPSVAGKRIAIVGRDSADAPVVRIYRIGPE
ncbi:MAG: 6-bladed beta-propeller, partial [Gemmatimonadales bacterium]